VCALLCCAVLRRRRLLSRDDCRSACRRRLLTHDDCRGGCRRRSQQPQPWAVVLPRSPRHDRGGGG
jgi:hypothetical protein